MSSGLACITSNRLKYSSAYKSVEMQVSRVPSAADDAEQSRECTVTELPSGETLSEEVFFVRENGEDSTIERRQRGANVPKTKRKLPLVSKVHNKPGEHLRSRPVKANQRKFIDLV